MNFNNCSVTIHAVNNYATITVSDPSNNTTFDISASNAYCPYYTYPTTYTSPINYTSPNVYSSYSTSFGPTGTSRCCSCSGSSGSLGQSGPSDPSGPSGPSGPRGINRTIYSYYS